jgi:hypothetical protein
LNGGLGHVTGHRQNADRRGHGERLRRTPDTGHVWTNSFQSERSSRSAILTLETKTLNGGVHRLQRAAEWRRRRIAFAATGFNVTASFLLRGLVALGLITLSLPVWLVAEGAGTRAATSPELAMLKESLEKTARDIPRWACTQIMIARDDKGRTKSETVVRYDPSKPYPEQWVPLKVNGQPPAENDFRKYRRWGERARARDENPEGDTRLSLGEVMKVAEARVVNESPRHLTFEIPLRKDRNNRFPPEKFEVLARLNRETSALENISVQLRASFRTKLVVKVKSGEGTLNFAPVDAEHPPTLVDLRGDASASIFFVSVGGAYELTRTDFKYVRPFYERFEVQIGPMKAIDF